MSNVVTQDDYADEEMKLLETPVKCNRGTTPSAKWDDDEMILFETPTKCNAATTPSTKKECDETKVLGTPTVSTPSTPFTPKTTVQLNLFGDRVYQTKNKIRVCSYKKSDGTAVPSHTRRKRFRFNFKRTRKSNLETQHHDMESKSLATTLHINEVKELMTSFTKANFKK